jgi:aconitate hydratase
MLEGATNAFTGEVGHGTNVLTGEKGMRLPEIARIYTQKAGGFVIIGDENYGEGSSREHAAMTPRFLGARAVIARSFARIHESNLKKQGILPFIFVEQQDYFKIEEYDRFSLIHLCDLQPGQDVTCVIKNKAEKQYSVMLRHTLTDEQIAWFKAGSALNAISKNP